MKRKFLAELMEHKSFLIGYSFVLIGAFWSGMVDVEIAFPVTLMVSGAMYYFHSKLSKVADILMLIVENMPANNHLQRDQTRAQ